MRNRYYLISPDTGLKDILKTIDKGDIKLNIVLFNPIPINVMGYTYFFAGSNTQNRVKIFPTTEPDPANNIINNYTAFKDILTCNKFDYLLIPKLYEAYTKKYNEEFHNIVPVVTTGDGSTLYKYTNSRDQIL